MVNNNRLAAIVIGANRSSARWDSNEKWSTSPPPPPPPPLEIHHHRIVHHHHYYYYKFSSAFYCNSVTFPSNQTNWTPRFDTDAASRIDSAVSYLFFWIPSNQPAIIIQSLKLFIIRHLRIDDFSLHLESRGRWMEHPTVIRQIVSLIWVVRLETKSCRILPLTYYTKYDLT